jgi:hypothetical protein
MRLNRFGHFIVLAMIAFVVAGAGAMIDGQLIARNRVTFTTATLVCRSGAALIGDAASPAFIHHHEADALAVVCPNCAVVPMRFKAVGPH